MKSSECYWKSGTKMATKLQSAKSAVSAKHKKTGMSIVPSVPLFKLFSTGIVEHHTKRDDFFMAWQGLEFFFSFFPSLSL